MHMNLEERGKDKFRSRRWNISGRTPTKPTSEPPVEAPAADDLVWNETSLPPKPNETPAGRLYHFGAFRGAAWQNIIYKNNYWKAEVNRRNKRARQEIPTLLWT